MDQVVPQWMGMGECGLGGTIVGGDGGVWTRWYHSEWGWGSVDQVVPQWVGVRENMVSLLVIFFQTIGTHAHCLLHMK